MSIPIIINEDLKKKHFLDCGSEVIVNYKYCSLTETFAVRS